jgi:hypothetical protein
MPLGWKTKNRGKLNKPFLSDLGSPDVVGDFVQPAHKLDLKAGAGRIVSETQVFRRAQLLKITRNTAASAWKASPKLVESLRHERKTLLVQRWPTKTFTGTKISELSEFLAGKSSIRIVVVATMLDLDKPLIIRGSNLILDLSRVSIKPKGKAPAFAVRIEGANNIALLKGRFSDGDNGILISRSQRIAILGNELTRFSRVGIVVTDKSERITVAENSIHHSRGAGLFIKGGTNSSLIERNEVHDLTGNSNWMAGFVLSDRNDVSSAQSARPGDGSGDVTLFKEEPIFNRLSPPTRNMFLANHIYRNISSGIYNDGSVANVFHANLIERNSKEGTGSSIPASTTTVK